MWAYIYGSYRKNKTSTAFWTTLYRKGSQKRDLIIRKSVTKLGAEFKKKTIYKQQEGILRFPITSGIDVVCAVISLQYLNEIVVRS